MKGPWSRLRALFSNLLVMRTLTSVVVAVLYFLATGCGCATWRGTIGCSSSPPR